MVVSIAAYAEEADIRKEVAKSFDLRVAVLDIVYGIPGYREASLATKNYIYDIVRDRVAELS